MTEMATMILQAQQAGYHVRQDDEDGLWYVDVPHRPRHPAHTQGSWKSSERAWRSAALIYRGFPDVAE